MQDTSALYDTLIASDNHWFETKVNIAGVDYAESMLMSIVTTQPLFNQNTPVVGSAVSGEITLTMINPPVTIPKMARVRPYVRVRNATQYSEWIPKGIFFIDTREISHNSDGLDVLTIHGYDYMLMFEQTYPSDSSHDYPLLDRTMVSFMASTIGVPVDSRTNPRMNKNYRFPLPVGYSCREMLSIIAASYGGNFIMTDEGKLLLVKLGELPKETNYLILNDQTPDPITFGGDRILV